jgi:hypothetical protein
MENNDVQIIKGFFKEIFEENKTIQEKQFEIIDLKLDNIQSETANINKRVIKLEVDMQNVQKNEISHNLNCPQLHKIMSIEKEIDKQKNIKGFFVKGIAIVGGIAGLILGIFKVIELFNN